MPLRVFLYFKPYSHHANLSSYTKKDNVSTLESPDRDDVFDDKETPFLFAMLICDDKLTDIVIKYVSNINMKDSQNRNAFFYLLNSKVNISSIETNLEKLLKKGFISTI